MLDGKHTEALTWNYYCYYIIIIITLLLTVVVIETGSYYAALADLDLAELGLLLLLSGGIKGVCSSIACPTPLVSSC